MKQIKFSIVIAIFVTAMAALLITSCGESSQVTKPPHSLTPEEQERLITETTENLNKVAQAGSDVSLLPEALTGTALEETTQQIQDDLAQGKVKKREYQNINISMNQFNYPIAQVVAEYDDYGYYADANSGASLTQPSASHVKLALAVIEEDGRWKIDQILAASTPETPKELPEETGTSTQPANQ